MPDRCRNATRTDEHAKPRQNFLYCLILTAILMTKILDIRGRDISAPPFRRRRLGAADSALENSAPCRFGAGHFGAVS